MITLLLMPYFFKWTSLNFESVHLVSCWEVGEGAITLMVIAAHKQELACHFLVCQIFPGGGFLCVVSMETTTYHTTSSIG